jgi:hypothetical protein
MKFSVYKLVFPKMEFIGVGIEVISICGASSDIINVVKVCGFALQPCIDIYLTGILRYTCYLNMY